MIFAAGNDGDTFSTTCTISSPGISKNVLAVGSSSSGETRYTFTNADGEQLTSYSDEAADMDTVSFFSSYGPSTDNRIKPELVAPGDMVRGGGSWLFTVADEVFIYSRVVTGHVWIIRSRRALTGRIGFFERA